MYKCLYNMKVVDSWLLMLSFKKEALVPEGMCC